MLSASSINHSFNVTLAMAFAALATAAAVEFRAAHEAGEQRDPNPATRSAASGASAVSPEWSRLPAGFASQRIEPSADVRAAEHATPRADVATLAGAARAVVAPVEARLGTLSPRSGVIFEEVGAKSCIGGTGCAEHCAVEAGGCDVRPAFVIKLDRPAYLSALQLYAHDQIGPTRRAELLVKVDGVPAGKTPVYRFGSTLTVRLGRIGQLVTVESAHQRHGFLMGGEEAVIWDLYLFGRAPR